MQQQGGSNQCKGSDHDSGNCNILVNCISQVLKVHLRDYLDDDGDARAGDPWPLRQGGSNQGRGSDALSPLYGSQPD